MFTRLYRVRQSKPAHAAGSDKTLSQHNDRETAIRTAKELSASQADLYVECRLYADELQLRQDKPYDTDLIWASWL